MTSWKDDKYIELEVEWERMFCAKEWADKEPMVEKPNAVVTGFWYEDKTTMRVNYATMTG